MENTLAERMMIHRDGGGIVAEYDDSDDCYDYNYDPGSSVFTRVFQKKTLKTKGDSIIFGECWTYKSGLRNFVRASEVPFLAT